MNRCPIRYALPFIRVIRGFFLILAAVSLPLGCSRQSDPQEAEVRQVLLAMHEAMINARKDAYMSLFVGNEDELAVAEAIYEFNQAGLAFEQAMVDAHGEEAWRRFQKTGDTRLKLLPRDNRDLRECEIRIRGDKAMCIVQEARQELGAQLIDGQWRLIAADLLGRTGNHRRAADAMFAMAEVVNRYRDKLVSEGASPDDIDAAMNEDLHRASRLAPQMHQQ